MNGVAWAEGGLGAPADGTDRFRWTGLPEGGSGLTKEFQADKMRFNAPAKGAGACVRPFFLGCRAYGRDPG